MRSVVLKKTRNVGKSEPTVRRCRECGCTDLQACAGGCWWVGPDLCSTCEKKTPQASQPTSRGAVTPTDRRP